MTCASGVLKDVTDALLVCQILEGLTGRECAIQAFEVAIRWIDFEAGDQGAVLMSTSKLGGAACLVFRPDAYNDPYVQNAWSSCDNEVAGSRMGESDDLDRKRLVLLDARLRFAPEIQPVRQSAVDSMI